MIKKIKKITKISEHYKTPKKHQKIFFIKTKKSIFLLYFDIKSIITTYKLRKL